MCSLFVVVKFTVTRLIENFYVAVVPRCYCENKTDTGKLGSWRVGIET